MPRYLDSLEQIRAHRQAILDRHGRVPLAIDVADLIEQMREEREEQILGGHADERSGEA